MSVFIKIKYVGVDVEHIVLKIELGCCTEVAIRVNQDVVGEIRDGDFG